MLVKTLTRGRIVLVGAGFIPELAPFGVLQTNQRIAIDRAFGPAQRTLRVNDPFGQIPVSKVMA